MLHIHVRVPKTIKANYVCGKSAGDLYTHTCVNISYSHIGKHKSSCINLGIPGIGGGGGGPPGTGGGGGTPGTPGGGGTLGTPCSRGGGGALGTPCSKGGGGPLGTPCSVGAPGISEGRGISGT